MQYKLIWYFINCSFLFVFFLSAQGQPWNGSAVSRERCELVQDVYGLQGIFNIPTSPVKCANTSNNTQEE